MAEVESQVDLTRKLQAVEHDRIELVQQAVEVLRSIQSGNEVDLTQSLSGVIGLAYLLGVQMGVAPHRIDKEIMTTFRMTADVDDTRHTEWMAVVQYLATGRDR